MFVPYAIVNVTTSLQIEAPKMTTATRAMMMTVTDLPTFSTTR